MNIIDFDSFVMRHGEGFTQQVVEIAERANGISHASPQPLDYRWNVAINVAA